MGGLVRVTGALAVAAALGCLLALGGCAFSASANGEEETGVTDRGGDGLRVECSRLISGGERRVELSDDAVVSWSHEAVSDPLEGDGLSDNIDYYTFQAKAPGSVAVLIADFLPWADTTMVEDLFWLDVDDKLAIKRREPDLVKSFELSYVDAEEGPQVIGGTPGDASFMKLYRYRLNERGRRAGERALNVPPRQVTALFMVGGVFDWDGFSESMPVEDGASFTFEATLESGKIIKAKGDNAFPEGFEELRAGLYEYLGGL